jgi:hypothetical protein
VAKKVLEERATAASLRRRPTAASLQRRMRMKAAKKKKKDGGLGAATMKIQDVGRGNVKLIITIVS